MREATLYGGVKREKEKEKTRGFPLGDTASCFYFSGCWNVRATVEQKEKRRDVTQILAKRGSSSWWIRDVYRTYNTNPVFPVCFYSKSRGVWSYFSKLFLLQEKQLDLLLPVFTPRSEHFLRKSKKRK